MLGKNLLTLQAKKTLKVAVKVQSQGSERFFSFLLCPTLPLPIHSVPNLYKQCGQFWRQAGMCRQDCLTFKSNTTAEGADNIIDKAPSDLSAIAIGETFLHHLSRRDSTSRMPTSLDQDYNIYVMYSLRTKDYDVTLVVLLATVAWR